MADHAERSGVRVPIPYEEYVQGKTYYSDDDFTKILDSLVVRMDADVQAIREKIEGRAWMYVAYAYYRPHQVDPIDVKRRILAFRKKAEALLAGAASIVALQQIITNAADALADKEGLPDFEPELIPFESVPPGDPVDVPVWHDAIQNQIKKVYEGVRWLVRVLNEAERTILLDIKPPGNRPDEALHDFVRNIWSVYQEAASGPRKPYYDAEFGEEQGEFLDFLNTCLLPLGVNMTFPALLGLYRRAIEETKPHRTKRRRH